tara:strand:- start:96 stop:875 length:780 start_codon:yes stop_codon:yes gene_type:complete
MIILNNWYGRLGNNIIQLSNIIDIAIEYKHNIIFKNTSHYLFDISVIENYFKKYNNNEKIISEFFDNNSLPYPKDIFTKHTEERNKILKNALLINNIKQLPENFLVIHIRSGDIFYENPHPHYIPPPLSYYTKEINKHKYEKIIIICEDKINPIVNKLLELYKNSVYNKNTLEEDIRIILGAKNIISSVGTFVKSLMLLSDNIESYITPNNEVLCHLNAEELWHNDLMDIFNEEGYNKIMKPWRNTQTQRDYMLTYGNN